MNTEEQKKAFEEYLQTRINKLQSDLNYYTKPRRYQESFSPDGHAYYKSINVRLNELEILLKELK